jgi:predicted DNA-binding transcriptional regulator YafY
MVSILLLLQSAPRRTARELASRLEVSERTIYRDVDALAASGVPIYTERGAEGGIALAEGYRQALMHFGEDEVRALFISGTAILADLGMGPNLDRALEKLRGAFSETQRKAAEKVRGRIHIDQRRWYQSDPPVERLSSVRRAVWDDRCVELVYEDRSKARTTRCVEPYGLVSKAGVWYVVARTDGGFRSFRIDRIVELRELDRRFERDAAFDLDAYWKQSSASMRGENPPFCVTLRAGPEAIEALGTFWPSRWIERDGERLLLVEFPSENAAVSHLLTWSESVELIDPQSLAAAVLDRARAICLRYEALAHRIF